MSGVVSAVVVVVASVAGTIVSEEGQASAAKAQQQAYDRQAQIASINSQNAANARLTDIRNAQLDQADKAAEDRRQLASMRAAYGGSGLELAGTPLDVLTDTSNEMALDERRIGYQGELKGRSDALTVLGYQDAAAADTYAGQEVQDASEFSELGTGISGLSSAVGGGLSSYSAGSKAASGSNNDNSGSNK